jgi:hypothetical protein
MLDKVATIQEGITSIKDGETSSEQWHAKIKMYLGQQRNLVWIETLSNTFYLWSVTLFFMK